MESTICKKLCAAEFLNCFNEVFIYKPKLVLVNNHFVAF